MPLFWMGIVFILYIKFISESRQWTLITAWPEAWSSCVRWTQVQKTDFPWASAGQQVSEAAIPASAPSSDSPRREAAPPPEEGSPASQAPVLPEAPPLSLWKWRLRHLSQTSSVCQILQLVPVLVILTWILSFKNEWIQVCVWPKLWNKDYASQSPRMDRETSD